MQNASHSERQDSQLWEQFQNGSQEAFSRIYHLHFNDLYNYGCKLTANSQLAEDCIQDFFLYLWEHKEKLTAVQNIRYYLLKAYRRKVFQKMKQDQSRENRNLRYNSDKEEASFSFESQLIQTETINEKQEAIAKALELLSPRQKEVLYLKYFGELSYKEIASVLNLNYQTVVNHFYDAFKVLKKHKTMIWASLVSLSSLLLMGLF